MKIEPIEFEGNLNPKLFLEWMQAIKRFFEIKEYYDEFFLRLLSLSLKGMPPSGM